MHRFMIPTLSTFLLAIAAPTWAQSTSTSANLNIGVTQSQAISAVSLSNTSFAGGAASGTVVGTISVAMSPTAPPFSGTLSLAGANAASFQIVGANLETNGAVPAGTYSINIVATETGATGSPFTQAETITGTAPSASTCPRGTAYVSAGDGCQNAQASGSVQHPNFFTGYTGSTYPVRPPWNVAGVDYPVGYSTSITLQTPTPTALQAQCPGASYSGNSLTITGSSNCTINGFDFTKVSNCAIITITDSATVTFTNNNVRNSSCSSWSVAMTLSGTGTYYIEYNDFVGSNPTSTPVGGLMNSSGGGTCTCIVEYNAFLNTVQSDIQPSSPATFEVHYNYAENVGCCGNHGDFNIGNNSSGILTENMSFNTVYGHNATATTLCYITAANNSGTVTGSCNYETLVGNPGGGVTVAYLVEISAGTLGNWSVNNNYMDANGSYGFFDTQPGYDLIGTITCTGNINLNSGGNATGTLAGATCN